MKIRAQILAVIMTVFVSASTFAHNGDHQEFGFSDGFLHLLTQPSHVLLLVVAGLIVYAIYFTMKKHSQ